MFDFLVLGLRRACNGHGTRLSFRRVTAFSNAKDGVDFNAFVSMNFGLATTSHIFKPSRFLPCSVVWCAAGSGAVVYIPFRIVTNLSNVKVGVHSKVFVSMNFGLSTTSYI